jgi:dolichol-phosphate mannosyltransferase
LPKTPLPCIHIVIPVLNEAENISRLFADLHQLDDQLQDDFELHFVLVDDGSTDDTASRAEEASENLRLTIIQSKSNMGPGHAFGSAFENLAPDLEPDDWVVTMEGDNTSRCELLSQMLRRTYEGYDVVLASPYMYGGGITNTTAFRVFISHMANVFVKELLGIHGILTMSSFYRLYHSSTIRCLQKQYGPRIVETHGFECMIELLIKMINVRARISEVPLEVDTARRAGRSKMKIVRTIFGYIRLSWKKASWRIRSDSNEASIPVPATAEAESVETT